MWLVPKSLKMTSTRYFGNELSRPWKKWIFTWQAVIVLSILSFGLVNARITKLIFYVNYSHTYFHIEPKNHIPYSNHPWQWLRKAEGKRNWIQHRNLGNGLETAQEVPLLSQHWLESPKGIGRRYQFQLDRLFLNFCSYFPAKSGRSRRVWLSFWNCWKLWRSKFRLRSQRCTNAGKPIGKLPNAPGILNLERRKQWMKNISGCNLCVGSHFLGKIRNFWSISPERLDFRHSVVTRWICG